MQYNYKDLDITIYKLDNENKKQVIGNIKDKNNLKLEFIANKDDNQNFTKLSLRVSNDNKHLFEVDIAFINYIFDKYNIFSKIKNINYNFKMVHYGKEDSFDEYLYDYYLFTIHFLILKETVEEKKYKHIVSNEILQNVEPFNYFNNIMFKNNGELFKKPVASINSLLSDMAFTLYETSFNAKKKDYILAEAKFKSLNIYLIKDKGFNNDNSYFKICDKNNVELITFNAKLLELEIKNANEYLKLPIKSLDLDELFRKCELNSNKRNGMIVYTNPESILALKILFLYAVYRTKNFFDNHLYILSYRASGVKKVTELANIFNESIDSIVSNSLEEIYSQLNKHRSELHPKVYS